jgi:hypothetical protein
MRAYAFYKTFSLRLFYLIIFHLNTPLRNLQYVLIKSRDLLLFFNCFFLFSLPVFGFRPAPSSPRAPSVQKVRSVPSYSSLRKAPFAPASRVARKAPFAPRSPISRYPKLVKRPSLSKRPKPVRNTPTVQRAPSVKRVPYVRRAPRRS